MNTAIEPTQKTIEEIYKFYLQIYDSEFNDAKKRNLMTGALGYETWSWRVIGITYNAITAIAKNNFNLPKGLQRDHYKKSRAETYKIIFSKRLALKEWWDTVWDNDETILMTKHEHKKKELTKTFAVDYRLGFFRDAAGPGMLYTKKHEGEFIKRLCAEHKISY